MATEVATPPSLVVEASAHDPVFSLEDDQQLLRELNAKPYKAQAVWFLNAFWKELFEHNRDEAECVWSALHSCIELDPRKEEGNELDQFSSHRLLERVDKALTVVELRETLADIDLDKNKSMSLVEFLIYRFKVDWRALVHGPQGTVDEAKLALAEQKVEDAQKDIQVSELRASEARQALKESVEAEMKSKAEAHVAKQKEEQATTSAEAACAKEEQAKSSEETAVKEESDAFQNESLAKSAEVKATAAVEEQRAIQRQVEEALACVQREQDAFKAKCDSLERTSTDEANGIVKRNAAKAELAQLQCSDPMPLQRAVISHNACVRRQERLFKTAAASQMAAQQARANAEQSREQAVAARETAGEERSLATGARRKAEQQQIEAVEARKEADLSHSASEEARRHSEKFKAQAEDALQKSVASFQDATQFLNKVKLECKGAGKGKLWWMWRELEEAKKYMSRAQLARLEAAPPLDADISPEVA